MCNIAVLSNEDEGTVTTYKKKLVNYTKIDHTNCEVIYKYAYTFSPHWPGF